MPTSAPHPDSAGFTLVEMLVVLTVLGLAAAFMAGRLAAEPGRFAGERQVAMLERAAAEARAAAIRSGRPVALDAGALVADASLAAPVFAAGGSLVFYPDGSSTGGTIEVAGAPALAVDWLTGETERAR